MKLTIKPNGVYKTDKDNIFGELNPLNVKYEGVTFGLTKELYNDLQIDHRDLKNYLKGCNELLTSFLIKKGYNTPNVKQVALIADLEHLLVIQDEIDNELLTFDSLGYITNCFGLKGEVILKQDKPSDFDKGWYKYIDGEYVVDEQRKDELIGVVL
jgi:hypothetical protein